MVMPYHLHMPSYFLETFTEYPELLLVCGAGGSRTLVQTRKPYAFYMLIFA